LSLIVAVLVFATGAVPALGQDFDFAAVPRVTFGLTNQGPIGGLCSTGLLNFSRSVGAGAVIGTLLSGNTSFCGDLGSEVVSGGALSILTGNNSVNGVIGSGEFLLGQLAPNGHAIVALDIMAVPGGGEVPGGLIGVGMTALVERHGTTFSQGDIVGTWRVKALVADQFPEGPGGQSNSIFGSIRVFANRSVTGTLNFSDSHVETITDGTLSLSSSGELMGTITTVFLGDVFRDVDVKGLMAPDKNFVAGVTHSERFGSAQDGMFFLQKEPTGTTYTQANLAGTWNLFALQAGTDDSSDGVPFLGTLTFNSSGVITSSNLISPIGTFSSVVDSLFQLDPQGFINGFAEFDDESFLEAQATMFKEKNQIIGVNLFEDSNGFQTAGLFVMFKQGPPPPASIVQFSTGNYSVQEGMTATITVNRTGATTTVVTVDYVVTDPFFDGSVANGTITFPAGATSRTFTVPTIGNFSPDADRILGLALANPTNGATLGARSTANLIVLNDDSTFAFSQPTYTVSEKAGKATITVNRSGGLGFPASVPFTVTAGTAVAGKDFVPTSGNLSFAKNIATAKFDVTVKDNTILDGERTVVLQLFPATPLLLLLRPAGAAPVEVSNPTAILTITDDDTPGVIKLSSATYSGTEGASVIITIVRAPATAGAPLGGNVSVDYFTSNNGSAIGGLDYTVTAGTVTFTGTQTMQTVSIPLTKDNIAEGPEHFLFNLGTPSSGTLGSPSVARVNINDIDKGGVVTLSASTYSVTEGAGNVSITVKRTGGTAANVSVQLTTSRGTASDGVDYGDVSTTVVFGFNETTKTVFVPIFQDTDAEGNETFNVTLSNPQGGATLGSPSTAVVTIVDDESAITFAQAAFSAKEGTPGRIAVTRSGALKTPATVTYNISSVTALPGVDFSGPVSGSLSFAPNVSQMFLMIPTIDNKKVDGDRSVLITLSNPTGGAQLASPSTATFTIVDDDQAGVFRMGAAGYTVKEGGSVMVDILRLPAPGNSGPLGADISISFATSSGNASAGTDFVHTSGTVVFGPLETKRSVPIQTLPDTIVDPGKNFFFTLSAPGGGATLGSPASANILIQDDDSAGVVFLSQAAYKVSEAAGNISITVMRTGGTANASVHFATVPGTATDGVSGAPRPALVFPIVDGGSSDYGAVSMTLNFGAGEMKKTVVIPIFQDGLAEGDEVFTVELSNAQGGLKLGKPASAPVVITDDEVVIQFANRFQNNQPVVVRTGPLTANVSVQFMASSGTAIQGEDFDLQPGTLVFPPGVSVRTIPIKTFNDNVAEGPETFIITLMNPSPPAQLGPNFTQVFTLDDNDFGGIVNFANTSPTAMLGQSKPIVVTRTGGLGTVMTVDWSVIGGTAVPDSDFSPASGRFTFLANQTTQSFSVNISEAASAAGKTIVFGLMPPGLTATPPSSKLGPANVSTLTILGAPTSVIQFAHPAYTVFENEGFATITVKRSGDLSQPATVHYATSNGTATTSNEDYSPTSGTLTFPASEGSYQRITFNVEVSDDGTAEGSETVNLALSNPSSNAALGPQATAVLTINDPQGNYNFTVLYSGGTNVGLPSLNDAGKFAFSLGSTQTVYSGHVDAPLDQHVAVALPNGDASFIWGFRNPVDESEHVAFLANLETGGPGVVVGFNGSATVIYSSADLIGEPSVSVGGYLAFKAIVDCEGPCDTVLLGNVDGGVDVAAEAGDSTAVGGVDQIAPNVAVNNNGVVAFVATTFNENKGIFRANDRVVTTLASTAGGPVSFTDFDNRVSINTFGEVAFVGTLPDGNKSIVVASPGNVIVRTVTSPGGFVDFGNGSDATVLINDNGDVAFIAFNAGGGHSLYVGNDPVNDRVVSTGDIIDGRQVVSLQLGGWNSAGQLTFLATLFNGTFNEVAAILATPNFAP